MYGCHVHRERGRSLADSIDDAVAAAAGAGVDMRAAAFFVAGPRDRRVHVDAAEAARLRERFGPASARPLALLAHSAYAASPWGHDGDKPDFVRRELGIVGAAGGVGLVVHLPRRPHAEVLAQLPELLGAADAAMPALPRLYLETPALVDYQLYADPAQLGELWRGVRRLGLAERVGLCVDTAHLWTAGIDIAAYEPAAEWLAALTAGDGPAPADLAFHLNDSDCALGRGPDRHAALGQGRMWGSSGDGSSGSGGLAESGLAAFVDWIDRHGSVAILERRAPPLADYTVLAKLSRCV